MLHNAALAEAEDMAGRVARESSPVELLISIVSPTLGVHTGATSNRVVWLLRGVRMVGRWACKLPATEGCERLAWIQTTVLGVSADCT